jgi:hypothetical protein
MNARRLVFVRHHINIVDDLVHPDCDGLGWSARSRLDVPS